jgi:hypothetical protein
VLVTSDERERVGGQRQRELLRSYHRKEARGSVGDREVFISECGAIDRLAYTFIKYID